MNAPDSVDFGAELAALADEIEPRLIAWRRDDVVVNDPALTAFAVPVLEGVAGAANVCIVDKLCAAEDFSFFQKVVPGFFFRVGCTPPGRDIRASGPNHSPRFFVDEGCLKLGVKSLCALALAWLGNGV